MNDLLTQIVLDDQRITAIVTAQDEDRLRNLVRLYSNSEDKAALFYCVAAKLLLVSDRFALARAVT
jgi:hypothetical protein